MLVMVGGCTCDGGRVGVLVMAGGCACDGGRVCL